MRVLKRLLGILLGAAVAIGAAQTIRVLDPLAVSAGMRAETAVETLTPPANPERVDCDIAIFGASTGGVAAALAAASSDRTVCLTEETGWIGGQITAQGVSALDENRYTQTTAGTASYQAFREGVRRYYRDHYRISEAGRAKKNLNPGNCWVSELCFEASVGLRVLEDMLRPAQQAGRLRIFLRSKAVAAKRTGRYVDSVTAYSFGDHRWREFRARYVLDATDLGELLPLLRADFVRGAESRAQTGEPHARSAADPDDIQSITYPFVLQRSERTAALAKPAEYEEHKAQQPYSFTIDYGHGKKLTYGMFEKGAGTPGSFWSYRRLTAALNFEPGAGPPELSMINWPGNDYCAAGLLSDDPLKQAEGLREGKLTSLGFAYWLQEEAPRDDGRGRGYDEVRFVKDALGSPDGLSQFPYVRESRRIHALTTIREQDIASPYQKHARAALFGDSIGIGWYPTDIHSCSHQDFVSETKPFQIPLGALIPADFDNLLAASKDIGTTHITNGAYRLHPVEWAIGEAAARTALLALRTGATPAKIDRTAFLLEGLQKDLVDHGSPIFWFDDLPLSDPAFSAAQFSAARGLWPADPDNLHFRGDAVIESETARRINAMLPESDRIVGDAGGYLTRSQFAERLAKTVWRRNAASEK